MFYESVEFTKEELESFQMMFQSAGASLLSRIMVKNAGYYEDILHDPMSNLEQVRFAQGALEGQGKLILVIKKMKQANKEEASEEQAVDEEEAETPVDVFF